MKPRGAAFFSGTYSESRERFLAAAREKGAALHALPIDARGPQGEVLATDIAWLGDPAACRVLVHVSGTHGVEGFAGSAVQLAVLGDPPFLPAGTALVLVHVLNPYGMAWLRRVNESNVDLNRNFVLDSDRPPASPAYRTLDGLLNPPTPPATDGFYPRAALMVLRHGFAPLSQAIAEGQYEFPKGLFYGGAGLEPGPAAYLGWMREHLRAVDRGFVIDVHTGLGRPGEAALLLHAGSGDPVALSAAMEHRLVLDGGEAGYVIRGGHAAVFERRPLPFVTQEFGTYPGLRVLHALREENRWHHHGAGTLDHPAKRTLKERFAPAAAAWRNAVVGQGVAFARAAAKLTFA